MIAFYALVRRAKKNTTLFDFAFIFGAAAYVCALTGDIFWEKGCLDFIYLKPLFIFDLKDLYINCFLCLVIVLTYKYRQQLRASPKDVIRKLVELAKYK
jgi:uncharacterized membrane protein